MIAYPQIKHFTLIALAWLMLLYGFQLHAQSTVYPPKNHTYAGTEAYAAFLTRNTAGDALLVDKKLQKQYITIITGKNTEIIKELNGNSFLFDADVYPYLNAIFEHILQKNDLDKGRFHFFVDRTSGVNAYSDESGTIVCNLGLVNIMENESQLAMVFCHELGHYLLKHVNTSITDMLTRYSSPEFVVRVKKIKKQEYNVNKQLEELLQTDVFDRRRHNRLQESAADSLGIVLYRNTGYNGANIAHIFDLLAAAENSPATGMLQSFFKAENIPLNGELLKPARRMSFGSVKKEITDSLKTHPDCAIRKVTMQSNFNKSPKAGSDFLIGGAQKLTEIKKIAIFDAAAYAEEKDNLSLYLYQLIKANTLYADDTYIKSEIFNTLLALCEHQKMHTLHTVVTTQYIADNDNDEYLLLLKMFDSIDLETMTDITSKYYQTNKSRITASAASLNYLKQLK